MNATAIATPEALFTLKDWIYLIGLGLTAGTFIWKLQVDAALARYRETVAFIEKREKDMRDRWAGICKGPTTEGSLEEEIYIFTGQLELVALLLHRKIFDEELVYNYWWRYFDEPLQNKQINTWIVLHREADSAVLEHYLKRCEIWSTKLDIELGRKPTQSWWMKLRIAAGWPPA